MAPNAVKVGASGYLLKKEVQARGTMVQAVHTLYRGDVYMPQAITEKLSNVISALRKDPEFEST